MGNRQSGAQNHDVPGLVDEMLSRGLAARATDVHFEPGDEGLLVRARIDGQLVDLELLPTSLSENVVSRLKVLASLLTYRVDIPQEGSFLWERGSAGASDNPVDLRVATFPTIRGERASPLPITFGVSAVRGPNKECRCSRERAVKEF
ncbi:MAG: ATPase, T2SS/T4P/T4SS family [Planctomycetota bacterium]